MVRLSTSGLALLLACGCGTEGAANTPNLAREQPEPSFFDDTSGPLPERIEELGLYPDPAELGRTHPRALRFEPAYPLWSNGSTKGRFLVLPPGERVVTAERDAWSFPVGTLLLKTFSYPSATDGRLRPVETRVLKSTAEAGWQYAVYLWDEAGTSATLLDITRSTPIEVELDGEQFEHVVPSKLDCRKCHESTLGSVLGFREIQLGAGDGQSELVRLAGLAVFSDDPPSDPARIEHEEPVTAEVLRYLQGNCVHCHNGGAPPAAFDMQKDVALENLIGRETQGELLSGIRVVPGDPEASVVYLTLARRTDISGILPMPPVGVQRADANAVQLMRGWIEGL